MIRKNKKNLDRQQNISLKITKTSEGKNHLSTAKVKDVEIIKKNIKT